MAINYPGPYELRIKYTITSLTSPTIQHVQRLNVSLEEVAAQGDVFGNYVINDIDGVTTSDLDTLVEAFLAIQNALYHTSTTIDGIELWKYPTAQSHDSVFWSTYTPIANAGTSVSAAISAGQDILTFRTQEGGTMKLSLMEDVQTPGVPKAYAAADAVITDLVDFILDGDAVNYSAPFLGRDTSYPFAFNRQFPGRNEHLWKNRNGR